MTVLSERQSRASARSRGLRLLAPAVAVLDLGIVTAACALGVLARNSLPTLHPTAGLATHAALVAPFLIVGWSLMLVVSGAYAIEVFGAGTDEFKRVFNASASAAALLCIGCYLFRFPLSRGFFVLTFLIGVPVLLVGRILVRRALHRMHVRGSLLERVLIVGGPAHIDEIAGVLRRERWLGYHVVGALTPGGVPGDETEAGVPIVGAADIVSMYAYVEDAGILFLAGGADVSGSDLRRLVWALEERHVQVVMAPSMTEVSGERLRVQPVGGLPLVHLAPPTWSGATRIGKRTFDVLGSGLGLLLISPLLLGIALRIKLHDGGPVLFRQTRVGRDGEEFGCLKFRTMVTDAEAMVAKLQEEHGASALLFKIKDDPRITKPGQWLRRFSADELPQLINVFRGDMSLVGPRPQVPQEVAEYDNDALRRLHIRPGMTGLWQVSGRSNLTWEEAVRLDLFYIDNWSMVQDLTILAKTLGVVFSRDGAY